jgi:hypothetical protein
MSNALRTPEDYELFIYTFAQVFPSIRHSTLTLVRKGASLGRVAGKVQVDEDYRLTVRERLSFDRLPGSIGSYGMSFGEGVRSCSGTIRSLIQMIRRCSNPTLITNIFHRR